MFEQLLDALFERRGRGGAARTGALHLKEYLALLEAAIDDIAAVPGHGRADARIDQFADLRDDFGIFGIIIEAFGRNDDLGGTAFLEQRRATGKMIEHHAQHIGFEPGPWHALRGRHRDEIAAKKHAGHIAKIE